MKKFLPHIIYPAVLPLRRDQVAAYSRLLLAAVALFAITVDPTQPARFRSWTYAILLFYVALSCVLAYRPFVRRSDTESYLVVHGVDIALISVLTYLTEGPTSPFFLFFTFSIVVGGLHWGLRGVLSTAALVMLVFLVSALLAPGGVGDETNRILVRAAYLLAATILVGFLGWHRERHNRLLQRLSNWPVVSDALDLQPMLQASLGHAALVIGIPRIAIVWREVSSAEWHMDEWNPSGGRTRYLEADPPPMIREPGSPPRLSDDVMDVLATAVVVQTVFEQPHVSGALILIDPPPTADDLEQLARIAAGHIALELEQFYLRQELAQHAISRERERLSRDMHDGILQDLTAVSLHLEVLSHSLPEDKRQVLEMLTGLMREQQVRIRSFVNGLNPGMRRAAPVLLQPRLEEATATLSKQWRVAVIADVDPADAKIPETDVAHLRSLIGEAVANAVRHGGATRIKAHACIGDAIHLDIVNDGAGVEFEDGISTFRPTSLRERVRDLGGTITAAGAVDGHRISVVLPLGND